jgi:hypothetical protein
MRAIVVVSSPLGFHIFRPRSASFGADEGPSEASVLEALKEEHFLLFRDSEHAAAVIGELEHKCPPAC